MSEGSLKHRDYWAFEKARQEALKSDFKNIKIGAVLVCNAGGGYIVSTGHNQHRSDPYQAKMNRYRRFKDNNNGYVQKHELHAEIDAIKNIPYKVKQDLDWKNCALYVYRICEAKPMKTGLARCCPACFAAIKEISDGELRNIYYTTDYGFAYERLEV